MNRREFLKLLGIGVVSLSVPVTFVDNLLAQHNGAKLRFDFNSEYRYGIICPNDKYDLGVIDLLLRHAKAIIPQKFHDGISLRMGVSDFLGNRWLAWYWNRKNLLLDNYRGKNGKWEFSNRHGCYLWSK